MIAHIKNNFLIAKTKRAEASKLSMLKAAEKMRLADDALDAMELVIAALIYEVESINRVLNDENR